MEIAKPTGRVLGVLVGATLVLGITACSPNPAADIAISNGLITQLGKLAADDTDTDYYAAADDWVVVHFASNSEYSAGDAFRQLEDTEYAADDALNDDGLGLIDGNEVGGDSYDIYFVGFDRDHMWEALAPVFAAAPLQWTSVELYDGLEDPDPVTFSSGQ